MGAPAGAVRLGLLAIVALAVVAGSSLLGPTRLEWSEVFSTDWDNIFWKFRATRTLQAACAGAGLALGGVLFQTLFRNPLATPFTLGIAAGSSCAAAIGFFAGVSGSWLGFPPRVVLAFGGALAAMALVYLMSRARAGRDMTRLLLAGVCVMFVGTSGVMLTNYLAEPAVTNRIVMWLMGSLADLRGLEAGLQIGIVLVVVLAFALYAHRALDLIWMGEDIAASRGVPVAAIIWSCYLLVGLLTAVIVANCGPIGFVGLMVPHIARALVGFHTAPLVIASALTGAAFLAACDGLARSLLIYEIPVGVVTNIIGATFFFYLLATRDVAAAESR